jgi:hypothetical protein
VFTIAMILLWQERRREDERAEEQRRCQAVMVSPWIEVTRTPQGGRELFFPVHNASEMPIFEVSLPMPVQIEFLDNSGHHWTRDEQGFLTRTGGGVR